MSSLRAVAALALTHHDRGLRALPLPGPTQRAILAANACTVLALLQPLGVTPRPNEYAGTVGLILGFLVLLVLPAGGVFVSWLLTWRRIRDGSLGTQPRATSRQPTRSTQRCGGSTRTPRRGGGSGVWKVNDSSNTGGSMRLGPS